MSSRLLTLVDAAHYLSMSPRELRARIRRGEIGVVKGDVTPVVYRRTRGGRDEQVTYERAHLRVRLEDLDAWVSARYIPPAALPPVIEPAEPTPAAGRPYWERIPQSERRFS